MNIGDLVTIGICFIILAYLIIEARNDLTWNINQLRKDIKEIKKSLYIIDAEDEEGEQDES